MGGGFADGFSALIIDRLRKTQRNCAKTNDNENDEVDQTRVS